MKNYSPDQHLNKSQSLNQSPPVEALDLTKKTESALSWEWYWRGLLEDEQIFAPVF
jgi:hypothetical protein